MLHWSYKSQPVALHTPNKGPNYQEEINACQRTNQCKTDGEKRWWPIVNLSLLVYISITSLIIVTGLHKVYGELHFCWWKRTVPEKPQKRGSRKRRPMILFLNLLLSQTEYAPFHIIVVNPSSCAELNLVSDDSLITPIFHLSSQYWVFTNCLIL